MGWKWFIETRNNPDTYCLRVPTSAEVKRLYLSSLTAPSLNLRQGEDRMLFHISDLLDDSRKRELYQLLDAPQKERFLRALAERQRKRILWVLDGHSGPPPDEPLSFRMTEAQSDLQPREPHQSEVIKSPPRRGRPRTTPNHHPEVDTFLDAVSAYAEHRITINDFCLVSGFTGNTTFKHWRSGNKERCNPGQARQFENTLKLSSKEFMRKLDTLLSLNP